MELSVYDIIKKPVITSKSLLLYEKLGKVTFEVNLHANKLMVKNAVEKIWNVKVAKVQMMIRGGKNKVFARRPFVTSDKKRAIITLKQGHKIDMPSMFETMGAPANESMPQQSEGKE